MEKTPQWQVEVLVEAPVARVWEAIEDLSLIPRYHPIVRNVEYVSEATRRAPGVAYKCVVPEGRQKGWCVERVVDHVPLQRTTVAISEDSWGMGKMFGDFLAETTVEARGEGATLVRIGASYAPRGLKMRLLDALLVRRMMRKRALATLEGLKRLVEAEGA